MNPLKDIHAALADIASALGTSNTAGSTQNTKLEAIDGHLNPLYSADYVAPSSGQ